MRWIQGIPEKRNPIDPRALMMSELTMNLEIMLHQPGMPGLYIVFELPRMVDGLLAVLIYDERAESMRYAFLADLGVIPYRDGALYSWNSNFVIARAPIPLQRSVPPC